jgi:hypothetical protein
MKSGALTDYLHAVGDVDGPILNLLKPFHGVELRKCLYHTDNPLLFWKHYAKILSDGGLKKYKTEVAKARRLWTRVEEQRPPEQDAYLTLHVGPLLMHEHLIQRFEMTEAIYRDYDAAAKAQYKDPSGFRDLLAGLSVTLLSHLEEFAPIEAYLKSGRKLVGFDRSTINRINATKKNIRELAAFMEHLGKSHRPLPAFQQLADTFLATFHTRWYGNREHDWAAEAPRFKRYTVNDAGPWPAVAGERRWTDDA